MGYDENMPKTTKNTSSWKKPLVFLGILVVELVLVWEAKQVVGWRRVAAQLGSTQAGRSLAAKAEADRLENQLKDIMTRRLMSLLGREDKVFAPMTACDCTWHDYEVGVLSFRYPEGLQPKVVSAAGEKACGPHVELTAPGDEDFVIEIGFGTERPTLVCGESCLSVVDHQPELDIIRLGFLPQGFIQETADQLPDLWAEEFTALVTASDGEIGHCSAWLRTTYRTWYQRYVAARVAGSLRITEMAAE